MFNIKTKLKNIISAMILILFLTPTVIVAQSPPPLGVGEQFVIFTSVGALTESGVSLITGDVGTNVGAVLGFVGILGTLHSPPDSTTAQCAIDVQAAWDNINAQPATALLGTVLGSGQVLTPEVYLLSGASSSVGMLTLDGEGNPNACFIFKIDGAFAAAASSTLILTNGAKACNIFWRVDGAASIATNSIWKGTMLIGGASDIGTNCNIEGKLLNISGAVSVESITITNTTCPILISIELLRFTAVVKDAHTQLNWATASETNNDYFTVEKSIDGINFEPITTVDGAGNSSQILNYSAIDNTLQHGISYYHLKQTDYNGQISYSNLVAVEYQHTNNSIFNIYPNPNHGGLLNLQLPKNNATVLVVVYDMLGKTIYSEVIVTSLNGSDIHTINLPQKLISGTYVITATSDNKFYNNKIIIR
jgi:hypothetical protein